MKSLPLSITVFFLAIMLFIPLAHAIPPGIVFYDNAETGIAFNVYNFSQGASDRVFNYSTDQAYNGTRSLKVNNTSDFQALYASVNAADLGDFAGYTYSAYFYDDGRAGTSLMGTGVGLQDQGNALFIGIYPPLSASTYYISVNATNVVTAVARTTGWHHAEIIFNSSTRVALLIDGVPVYNESVDDLSTNGPFLVFEEGFGFGESSYYDDILLYQTGNATGPVLPNTPPAMVTVQESVTANNLTLIIRANSTDTDNATVRYSTSVNRSGVIDNLGLSGYVSSGILLNYVNYTVSLAGNYSVCVFANDGLNNSATALCTSPVEITFPVAPNVPPSLRSALLTVNGDNTTLHLFANATDPDTATVDFSYVLVKDDIVVSSGSQNGVTQGVTSEIGTITLSSGTTGQYYFNVTVAGNATVVQSNTVSATVPAAVIPPDSTQNVIGTIFSVIILLIMIILGYAFVKGFAEETSVYPGIEYIFYILIAICGLAIVILLFSLL